MKIVVIFGTRPEIIKLTSVIQALSNKKDIELVLVYTGQHYDYEMSTIFLDELNIPKPNYSINVGSGTHAQQTSVAMQKIEKIISKENPEVTLVQGDTNSALAGAIAVSKLNVCLAHIEAGCRSYDRKMPEEINRVLIDHCSDILFAPTASKKEILIREGIPNSRIVVSGDTLIDFLLKNQEMIRNFSKSVNMPYDEQFGTLTVHRVENTINEIRLKNIFAGIKEIKTKLIFPIHPRTKKALKQFKINLPENVTAFPPVGFFDFINLLRNSLIVLTDSGGVQVEASFFKIPCLTLRRTTEWTETVQEGFNYLVNTNSEVIKKTANEILSSDIKEQLKTKECPLGKEGAGERIANILINKLDLFT